MVVSYAASCYSQRDLAQHAAKEHCNRKTTAKPQQSYLVTVASRRAPDTTSVYEGVRKHAGTNSDAVVGSVATAWIAHQRRGLHGQALEHGGVHSGSRQLRNHGLHVDNRDEYVDRSKHMCLYQATKIYVIQRSTST